MRVLVVNQDSGSNEAIARSLRDLYTVDAVTNKGDCLDLLRSNTFEVIVATERLEDGSGLELLGTVARKWPSVLRIFAADRHRLQLLKGRLGPFELFQTLTYPIDPDRLIATLNLAGAAQEAHADTSNIQHVVLSGEAPPEAPEQAAEGESEEFPAPQPVPRAASMDHSQATPRATRSSVRGGPSHRVRSTPGQRPRGNGAAGPPTTRMAVGASVARNAAPSPSLTSEGGRPSRHGRPSGERGNPQRGRSRSVTNRLPPVRFPPLQRTPPLEPPQESSASRYGASQAESFAEAAAMARAARSNFESPPEGYDSKRLAIMIGAGAAVIVAIVILGFKLFGSNSETSRAAATPVAHAPEYSQEVVDLVAQTESALTADDFKSARANIDKLRQLAPSHPRLAFFDGLLAQRSDASKGSGSAANSRGASKRGGQPPRRSGPNATTEENANVATAGSPSRPTTATTTSTPSNLTSHTSAAVTTGPASGAISSSTASTTNESSTTSGFAPETPPGLTRSASSSAAAVTPHDAAAAGPTGAAPPGTSPTTAAGPAAAAGPTQGTAAAAPASTSATLATPGAPPTPTSASAADAASPASTHVASTSATRRPSAGEPPPVIREARLIRSVIPDYPSAAKHDGVEGSVDLEVTVSSRGVVEDIAVVHATPPDMFEKSAVAAVRKWKYDPRFVDGLPSEAHVKVHLDFGPGK